MKTNYHEKETIILKSPKTWDRRALHTFLQKRGFKTEDDFYELFRKGPRDPWQSSAIMSVTVFQAGKSVYETEEDIQEGATTSWDELRCEYLMATLPREAIFDFIREVDALVEEFSLEIVWNGEKMASIELTNRLNAIADHLSTKWDAPGSETLRILIQQQYAQR
jgi:hypothetical protein